MGASEWMGEHRISSRQLASGWEVVAVRLAVMPLSGLVGTDVARKLPGSPPRGAGACTGAAVGA